MAIFQNGSREINEEGYVVNSNNPFLIIPGDEAIPTETTIKARGKDWVVRDCQLKPYGTMEVYLSETRNQE